jgi:CubicO group peptidase (beta-lactamase class C family)
MYLEAMMQDIDQNGHNIHSVLIIHDGYLVWEEYPRKSYGPNTLHMLQSVTKSFSSTLIGIALQHGLLDNTSQRMVDLFSDWMIANMDARKESITLEHLLTMTDGMDWHETDLPYDHPNNTLGQMWVSDDAIQHVLDRPMARDPGESWFYNSGTSILLGGILEEVTGEDVKDFAKEHLFDPIGIGSIIWYKTTGNHYHTDGGLYMTPRDMARLGFLMLNNGTWNGNEIVSSEWVSEATRTHAMTPWTQGYGYQWWTFPDYGVYSATGHYEQKIYVIPEHDTVVVFTANIADEDPHPTDYFVFNYILQAIEIGIQEETEALDDLVNLSIAVLLVIPIAMAIIIWVFKIRHF